MPIEPRYVNVVAFFGKDSLSRLESMLRYYNKILSPQAWQDFLFILATPDGQSVAALPADLPKHVRCCCHDGTGDEESFIYQQTADRIRRIYHDGNLNLHLICNDFASGLFSAEAPANLVNILKQAAFGITIKPYYYLMLHPDDGIDNQRRLAQRLLENQERGDIFHPYLLSLMRDDHSLGKPDALWRAVMCEILVVRSGKRVIPDGTLSTLGYTSLNANEKELDHLRRQEAIRFLKQCCTADYPDAQAWNDILLAKSNDCSQWLKNIIMRDLPALTENQKNNFRILSGVIHQPSPDGLLESAEELFMLNWRTRSASMAAKGCSPQQLSAKQHRRTLCSRLVTRPNLCRFPDQVFETLISELDKLGKNYQPRTPEVNYPEKKRWQIWPSNKQYMLRCSELAESAARESVAEKLIPLYAEAYADMFTKLREDIRSARNIQSEIDQHLQPAARIKELQDKYPLYSQEIQSTSIHLSAALFSDICFYTESSDQIFSPKSDAIHHALAKADRAILSHMTAEFRSTFIRAINYEFNTSDEMNRFLGNYLSNKRKMFLNPLASPSTPSITYFCNNQLAGTAWAQASVNNTFFVENDNVERLDYFSYLQGTGMRYSTLRDYLLDRNAEDVNNLYFCRSRFGGVDLPDLPEQTFNAAPAAPAVHLPDMPSRSTDISMSIDDTKTGLSWNWANGADRYQIIINGDVGSRITVSRQEYNSNQQCYRIRLRSGKNHITLLDRGGSVVSQMECSGPPIPVHYRKLAETSELIISAKHNSAFSSLKVREMRGTDPSSVFYYPLVRIAPPRGKENIHYEDLAFEGVWDLVPDPTNPFCAYAPKEDVNL